MAEIFGVLGILSLFGAVGTAVSEREPEAIIFTVLTGACFGAAIIAGYGEPLFKLLVA
jgi:hypothetical protein